MSNSPTIRAAQCGWTGHENLVVVRTFSKAAGIAGLRLGYAAVSGLADAASLEVQAAVQRECGGNGGRGWRA